jgi:hypothetical protein
MAADIKFSLNAPFFADFLKVLYRLPNISAQIYYTTVIELDSVLFFFSPEISDL